MKVIRANGRDFRAVVENEKVIAQVMYEQFEANKKVSKPLATVSDFEKVCKVIKAVNSLEYYDTTLGGVRLEDVIIPGEFAFLVGPSRLAYDTVDLRYSDLLLRPSMPSDLPLNTQVLRHEMFRIQDQINSTMKGTAKEAKTAAELRSPSAFMTESRMCVEIDGRWVVRATDGPVWPVFANKRFILFMIDHAIFVEDAERSVNDYIFQKAFRGNSKG